MIHRIVTDFVFICFGFSPIELNIDSQVSIDLFSAHERIRSTQDTVKNFDKTPLFAATHFKMLTTIFLVGRSALVSLCGLAYIFNSQIHWNTHTKMSSKSLQPFIRRSVAYTRIEEFKMSLQDNVCRIPWN